MSTDNYYIAIIFVIIISPLIGSFLNVVIYRLPLMLEAMWRDECIEFIKEDPIIQKELNISNIKDIKQDNNKKHTSLNLAYPASFCPSCKTNIKFYDNIPIFSYLFLKGKCRACKTKIPFIYFFIEIITLCLSLIIVLKFGFSYKTLAALVLTWILIAASVIDYKHYILPDNLTIPTLWLGLIINLNNTFISIHLAVLSACIGYLLFWSIAKAYTLSTKKEGIGYGDFKLYALFGAWIGLFMLPQIIIISSFLAIFSALMAKLIFNRSLLSNPIPYGPFIAIAGYIALIYGDNINNWYLNFFVF
tara:strand:- start:54 stop:965 length:912 start_codon:yes stop_codon:yes gene_type:complete